MNFAICILRAKDMVDWQSLVGERPFLFEIPRADAIDIDWPEDFAFCEAEYKRRIAQQIEDKKKLADFRI
jgi:CMP-N-acetylneuraminic acid synthetase